MSEEQKEVVVPELSEIEAELDRLDQESNQRNVFKNFGIVLLIVAAIAVLVATLWLPFLRIYGTSMTPTLNNGEVVACMKTTSFEQGDIIAFYYNNKILVKRVIAKSGDWVDLKADGTVTVNGTILNEDYVDELDYGETNITFPFQVPESSWFVMGDHRSTSIDSRNTAVGCVTEEQIVGKVLFKIWPLSSITVVN